MPPPLLLLSWCFLLPLLLSPIPANSYWSPAGRAGPLSPPCASSYNWRRSSRRVLRCSNGSGSGNSDSDGDSQGDEKDRIEEFRIRLENINGSIGSPVDDQVPPSIPPTAPPMPNVSTSEDLWARALVSTSGGGHGKIVKPGTVLLARPEYFAEKYIGDDGGGDNSAGRGGQDGACDDDDGGGSGGKNIFLKLNRRSNLIDNLLQKYGLTTPLPSELGPDRIADLLPVLLIVETGLFSTTALLLNRRTGYLLGDLQQSEEGGGGAGLDAQVGKSSKIPGLEAFMIQPLWFGGTSGGSGMNMIHLAGSLLKGSKKLTDDGVYYGGDLNSASDVVKSDMDAKRGELSYGEDGSDERGGGFKPSDPITGFSFKFFVQTTKFLPLTLEKEISEGVWMPAEVSKEVIFKGRERMGGKRAKPIWKEIIELCDFEGYSAVMQDLYD